VIDGVIVRAPAADPNTDGIDPCLVTNAVVRRCDVDTEDEDIAIKSGGANISILNSAV
jgi:polygalacturonase